MKSVKSLISAVAALPLVAGAQTLPVTNITSLNNAVSFVCLIASWLFTFLIVLAVLFVVLAAYRYLTASGDPEKVKGASSTLIYAAVAIVVALLARSIPLIVGSLFNVSLVGC